MSPRPSLWIESGVIVHEGVDVVEADLGAFADTGGSHLATVRFPAATIGDPPEFLDVHVHQLTGSITFVAAAVVLEVRISSPVSGSHSRNRAHRYGAEFW